jgi:hypothetical protein
MMLWLDIQEVLYEAKVKVLQWKQRLRANQNNNMNGVVFHSGCIPEPKALWSSCVFLRQQEQGCLTKWPTSYD